MHRALRDPVTHTFDSIAGHDAAKRYLQRSVATGCLPHAILLHGPRGVGKTSMAWAVAKFAIGQSGGGGVWAEQAARRIESGVSTVVLLVEPRGPAGQITLNGWRPGKDDPDGLQYYRFVDSRPLEGHRKFLIFRNAERMNPALANFLLKLIEEPPPYLSIVLLAERPTELLPTIRSRCAPVRLSPLRREEMEAWARELMPELPAGRLDALLRLAEGRPGRLAELAAPTERDMNATAQLMEMFQRHGFVALFRTASELLLSHSKRGGDAISETAFEAALDALQTWFRDALITKIVSGEAAARLIAVPECHASLKRYVAPLTVEGLAAAAGRVKEAYEFAPRQGDKNYVLENMLLSIGRDLKS
jgi:DNA polymerase-3 subunit delta'